MPAASSLLSARGDGLAGAATHGGAASPDSADGDSAPPLALSPRGEALIRAGSAEWRVWALSLGAPDMNWRTLTEKIWYPGYPAPAWVWQSTPAGDSFAAGKFSLVPLAVGTLKAAFCAMLFATPLNSCA
ncbi:hypothetical protein [Sodalis sp. (in: enterobacteria)]|uniref:hypothetical protein n=1 Tax=Sodalis sp. (in: enterobacteria) TaxID=1898979 RepID=UPI003F419830